MIPLTREETLDTVATLHIRRQELSVLEGNFNAQAETIMAAARAQVDTLRESIRVQRRTLNQDIKTLEDRLSQGKPA